MLRKNASNEPELFLVHLSNDHFLHDNDDDKTTHLSFVLDPTISSPLWDGCREKIHPSTDCITTGLILKAIASRSRHTPHNTIPTVRSSIRGIESEGVAYSSMDPFRNAALQSAKLQSLLSSVSSEQAQSGSHTLPSEMPAPPAYHMVVDPNAHVPTTRGPFEEEEEGEDQDDEAPEITINAVTQVRGHGNIISIAQLDTTRIANLIATMLSGETPSSPQSENSTEGVTPCPQAPSSTTTFPSSPPLPSSSHATAKPVREFCKINVTVNCGATIIGDRNIVGPGLGDIARQMQVAQRNQALQAAQRQQQQQQQAQQAHPTQPTQHAGIAVPKTPVPGTGAGSGVPKGRETLYQAQVATPPMSRSASERSQEAGGGKRKRNEDVGACCAKKPC